MSDLNLDARDLLTRAQGTSDPDPATVARVRASVLGRVGVAATAGAATAATIATTAKTASASTAGALFGSSMMVKTLVVVGAVAAGSTAGYVVRAHHVEKTTTTAHAPAPAQPRTPPAAPTPVAVTATPAPKEQPIQAENAAVRSESRPAAPSKKPYPPKPAPPRAADAVPSLMQDVTLLRRARTALATGDTQEALAALEGVRADGPLAEEREGLRVLARCRSGAAESGREAEEFVRRRPSSPLVTRVRDACFSKE